jgi:hypothetical protein
VLVEARERVDRSKMVILRVVRPHTMVPCQICLRDPELLSRFERAPRARHRLNSKRLFIAYPFVNWSSAGAMAISSTSAHKRTRASLPE